MSLFEKLNNKRYNLREGSKDDTLKGDPWEETQQDKIRKRKKAEFKKSLEPSDISKNPDKYTVKVGKTIVDTEIVPKNKKYKPPSKAESDAIQTKSLINKTKKFVNKPAKTPKSKGSGTVSGSARPLVTNPKSKGNKPVTLNVNKTTVSSDKFTRPNTNAAPSAKEITKKYNQLNKNRPEFDSSLSPSQRNVKNIQQNKGKLGKMVVNPSAAQKARGLTPGDIDFKDAESLYKKRKARINPKTGKATRKGVEDFIFSRSGGNRPGQTHLSPSKIKELKRVAQNQARIPSIYKEVSDKINKSDYAGKRTRSRPSNAPSYAEIKKKIDAKNPTYIGKSGKPLPVAGTQSIVTPAGKLKSKAVSPDIGKIIRPGESASYKPYYPKTKRGKVYKFIKQNIKKAYKAVPPKYRKYVGGGLAIAGALGIGSQLYKPKPKPATYTVQNLKLNLSDKKKNKVPDPKNPGSTISRQSLALRDRNIYTGKLQKDVYKPKPPKPKSLSRAEIQKQYPDSVSKPSAFTTSKKYPRVSKKN